MYLSLPLTVLAAVAQLALASPAQDVKAKQGLRLVKTTEADPGKWVSEDEKIKFTEKGVGFIDITDIKDKEVLAAISDPNANAGLVKNTTPFPDSMQHVDEANSLISKVSTSKPQSWMRTLTNFFNRYYTSKYGEEAAKWLYEEVSKVAAANPSVKVQQFRHSFNQPSVIATLPGKSSDLVIVGAHFDSVARGAAGRAPGAEDNGSGTVVVLEALRVLAEAGFKPENTLEFHFYAGEEAGLLGSQDIFANYKSTGKRVLAMVNKDLAGYSPSGKISIYTDSYTDPGLNEYIRLVATEYSGSGAPTTSRCGYGCSDHYSAYANGFPSAFAVADTFQNISPYIHSSRDTYETIQWPTILRHTKFTVGFLVEASYL